MDTSSRIKEAEAYQSMGLLEDSLNVYEEIFSGISDSKPDNRKPIKEKIHLLKKEIKERKKALPKISSGDISIIKRNLSADGSVPETLESASALSELGLVDEAIAEYRKLFQFDRSKHNYSPAKIIPEFLACLLKTSSPENAVKEVERTVIGDGSNNLVTAQVQFLLGLEMERRRHNDLALKQFRSASKIDPKNKKIQEKLNSLLAKLSSGSRYDYLLNNGVVTSEQLQQALAISKKKKMSVELVLIEHYKIKKEEVGKSLSLYYGRPFKAFDPEMAIPVELIGKLKKSFLMHDLWVPLNWEKKGVEILVDDPKDLRKTGQIQGLIKTKKIILYVGIKEDIKKFISHFFDKKREEPLQDIFEELDMIPDITFEEEDELEERDPELDESTGEVVRLVDQVLVAAYRKNASDIHIEPSPISRATGIRFRIDGVCQEYIQVPNSMARGILSRLKIMADLDIAERRLPQDGKIKFKRKGIPPFELRVATLPTTGGLEDTVLRILAKAGAMNLDEMGLNERNLTIMKKIINQPYGLILVVGPTGSGKTTTLHSALGYINKPGIKIWTAEDPVEITQAGLRQVEVRARIGLDFARVMRAFLRADPDVIMIGEMRDKETASTGVEASLTGHLVFSTLHTNSAPETVTRLLDMGLNPLNFSDAFLGVLAQRLTRRLCINCRKEYHPSDEEFQDIVTEYGVEQFEDTNIRYTSDLTVYRAVGCEECFGSGYRGRLGIHELMEGTPRIKKLIKKEATSDELFTCSQEEGMATLKQDGINKVFQGLTDIQEIRRVCID